MKIALLIYSLNMGGAERVVSRLSKEFSKEHSVDIILFNKIIKFPYEGNIIDLDLPSKKSRILKIIIQVLNF